MTTLLRRPRSRAALAGFARVDDSPATRRAALLALPRVLAQQFSPAAAGDLHAVYELRVRAPAGAIEARFALTVADGTLDVERRPAPEATAWVSVGLGDMIRLISGATQVWPLMADQRLDIGGDPFTALRFPALFNL